MSNFETEYWNCVAPYKSKYEFIKLHFLMDIDECIKMLNKAKAEGNDKIVLDIMSKKLIYLEQKQKKTYRFNKGELIAPFFFSLLIPTFKKC